jgi:hypothetical protein
VGVMIYWLFATSKVNISKFNRDINNDKKWKFDSS